MDEYLDEDGEGRDLQDLYRAILQALASRGQIRYEDIEDWIEGEESEGKKQLDQILKALLERMLEEGYITLPRQGMGEAQPAPQGYVAGSGAESGEVKFELTNKAVDFLGYRTLRDLLSSLGRSSVGRHDTQELSTGVEASEAPKPYEFGDSLKLDIPGTLHLHRRLGAAFGKRVGFCRRARHGGCRLSACQHTAMVSRCSAFPG